jgi:hypothetical protein
MLKKLASHSLIDSRDRVRYASDSISLTIWFNNDSSIFAFEVVYDLLMHEKCFFYSRKTATRYSNIVDDESKVGRSRKQIIANKDIKFDQSRIDEFISVSKSLPLKSKVFILSIMRSKIQK